MKPMPTTSTHFDKNNKVWSECRCGWRSKKRTPGKRPRLIVFRPFHCPKCNKEMSLHTAFF
jgi:hypothetical protein